MKRTSAIILLCAILSAAAVISCEEVGVDVTGPDAVVLVPSKDRIDATGLDTISFTVFSGELDVTAEARIFSYPSNSELISKSFSATSPGDYDFYATYKGAFSDTVSITASGNLALAYDKAVIAADGTDMVTFTVTQDGQDVTDESTLYLLPEDGEPVAVDGNTFSTSEAGGYDFYATKGTSSSDVVSVMATPGETPSSWSFRDRSLILEITATWCGPCSMMKAGIKSLEQDGWDEGYVVEAHDNDALTVNSFFNQLINFVVGAPSFSIPLVTFNFTDSPRITSSLGSVAANADGISSATDEANEAYPCTAGANAAFYPDGEEGLKVSSTVAISEAGEYKVCCWLLENNIKMSQTSQSEAQQWDINNHINVLRAVSDISDIPGQAVTAGANETQAFEWNFSVSDLRNGRPQDSHVLVIISKKEADGTYIVNNVVRCEYKSAVEYEYE